MDRLKQLIAFQVTQQQKFQKEQTSTLQTREHLTQQHKHMMLQDLLQQHRVTQKIMQTQFLEQQNKMQRTMQMVLQ